MTQRDIIYNIAKSNYGVVQVNKAKSQGVTLNSIKKLAHDNDDFINHSRGIYVWYNENIDLSNCGYTLSLAQSPDNSFLYGLSVLELFDLGGIVNNYHFIATSGRARNNNNIKYIGHQSLNQNVIKYNGLYIQKVNNALMSSKEFIDFDKYLDAIQDARDLSLITSKEYNALSKTTQ